MLWFALLQVINPEIAERVRGYLERMSERDELKYVRRQHRLLPRRLPPPTLTSLLLLLLLHQQRPNLTHFNWQLAQECATVRRTLGQPAVAPTHVLAAYSAERRADVAQSQYSTYCVDLHLSDDSDSDDAPQRTNDAFPLPRCRHCRKEKAVMLAP